jgi:hypothetical protein
VTTFDSLSKKHLFRIIVAIFVFVLGVGCALAFFVPEKGREVEEPRGVVEIRDRLISAHSTRTIRILLSRPMLGELSSEDIRLLAERLVNTAEKERKDPVKVAASILPSASEILAMIARDRDVDDFIENSSEEGAAGRYYQNVVAIVEELQPLLPKYEALFEGLFHALSHTRKVFDGYNGGVTLPGLSSKPNERQYENSHTFALDIFLREVEVNGFNGLEKGPEIFSLSDGLVVAADSSWKGGETLETYRSGGITPKAGNGVIIYSPEKRRFFLYFHLHGTTVKKANVVSKGHPLGLGGNTGTNARKPGHGEHLHLEIYDAATRKFMRNREIARFVFD